MFKTNYFNNFQRLTGYHIASCLFSVWWHKIFYSILCAVGSQAGKEDSGAFLKFLKTVTFSRKNYLHKTEHIYLVLRFSPQTTKKTNVKKVLPTLKIFFWLHTSAWCLFTTFDSVKTLFDVCQMHCITFLKNIKIFWPISHKSHNNARDYI